MTVPSGTPGKEDKVLTVLCVPGDAQKRTAKAYRAHVWVSVADLDWVFSRLQGDGVRAMQKANVVGPTDYPNLVYSLHNRLWTLSWVRADEIVCLTRHVQNYRRTYPHGRRSNPSWCLLDPEEFSQKKREAAVSLIADAAEAGFVKPSGFEAKWGISSAAA